MPNITGSITAQKKRYINDFAIDSSVSSNNTITLNTGFPFVQVGENWSLSGWYCHKIDNGNPYVITNRQNGGSFNGWAIRLTNFTTYKTFTFLTDTSTGQTNYVFSSTDQLPKSARFGWIHFVFNYNSTTREMSLFADSKFVSSQVIAADEFQNPASECLFFAFWGGAVQTKAINKDYALFNRELTQREITYIYEVGVLPSSTHEAVQFHLPLNHVALIDGTDRLMLDVIENYNYAKTVNLSAKHGVMSGWTDDELGLNTGTSTFTAYADFYTKTNGQNFSGGGDAITYKGEELRYYGLQFDSVSGHNLTIQGLNTAKTNGYTFLVAVANKTNAAWTSGQANIFSHVGTEGSNRQFQIENSISGLGKALRTVFPSGSTTSNLISSAANDFDNSKIQFASFALSPNQDYYLTYELNGNTRAYAQSTFNTNVTQSTSDISVSNPLSFGFNEITNAVTKIGYDGTDSLDGVLCYFAIVEGLEDQATIKRQFNNGLLSNPSDFERLGLNLAFFADLNNPFDDAGTIKIPDLGDNNLTVIADSDLDSTWSTLSGVQSSQVELKTLL